ncbi:MAG: rhodanese-like domain-containing protein [Candidatus Omnitrophica bacterium]|nr:rhodanese-like domain-containing protein [Candidatus Omnitrophota bacterium]
MSCSFRGYSVRTQALLGIMAMAAALALGAQVAHAVAYEEISAVELKDRIDDKDDTGFLILDIRDPEDYQAGHLPGAINIPLKTLGYRVYSLDKTREVIAYCDHGIQSRVACQVLTSAGFKDVYNLTGGLDAWTYPLEVQNGRASI